MENIKIGKIFMYNEIEFKITYINKEKNRFTIEPVDKESIIPVNQIINIDNENFKIEYINHGKKRITLKMNL